MTELHKENMRKHIAFLRDNANLIRKRFDMEQLVMPTSITCGTSACSLGWAAVSVGWSFDKENELALFGIDNWDIDNEWCDWQYCFSGRWVTVNNSPEAAAARMEAVLYNQVPKEWKFSPEFSHPIVIVPEELETILSKSVNLELVDRH